MVCFLQVLRKKAGQKALEMYSREAANPTKRLKWEIKKQQKYVMKLKFWVDRQLGYVLAQNIIVSVWNRTHWAQSANIFKNNMDSVGTNSKSKKLECVKYDNKLVGLKLVSSESPNFSPNWNVPYFWSITRV